MAQFTQTEVRYLIEKIKEMEAQSFKDFESGKVLKRLTPKQKDKQFWELLHYGNYKNLQQVREMIEALIKPKNKK